MRQDERQLKAYELGTCLGQMLGCEALSNPAQTQRTLGLDDESTVCYLNGVEDAIFGGVNGDN